MRAVTDRTYNSNASFEHLGNTALRPGLSSDAASRRWETAVSDLSDDVVTNLDPVEQLLAILP